MNTQHFMDVALQAAQAAGSTLLRWRGRFDVREKGPADLVTQADLEAQQVVEETIRRAFPSHGFIGEEQPPQSGSGEYVWLVDPLDGTTNYVHGLPHYPVSIALARGRELLVAVVFNPAANELYTARQGQGAFLNGERLQTSSAETLSEALVAASLPARVEIESTAVRQLLVAMRASRAVRRMGSAALNLCYVASGRLDAYWASSVECWDIAAGMLLVREAGGSTSHLSGGPFYWQQPQICAAATNPLRIELLTLLRTVERET